MTDLFDWCPSYIQEIIHPLVKYLLHYFSGKCEIERILTNFNDGRHTNSMTIAFSSSIKHSKQLKHPQHLLFHQPHHHLTDLPTVSSLYQEIIQIKQMTEIQPLITANMKTCLKSLRLLNAVKIKLYELRTIRFEYSSIEHVQLLEKLWSSLKPNIRRRENTLITQEWTELGFQNKDPSSDFRGMGLLGLIQLVYFSESCSQEAINLLQSSQFDLYYFPFAATGINLTAYLIELVEKTCLYSYIIQSMDVIILQDSINSIDGCSEDEKCIQYCITLLHQFYGKLFIGFGKLWMESKPKDIMEFPKIFKQFKQQVELEHPPL